MVLERNDADVRIHLNQERPVNFCHPAADPLFCSTAKIYGANVLGVVLTGMGSDGVKGSEIVTKAGGTIIAQDHDTSVVWGMPGNTARTGLCSAVLPLDEIPGYLKKITAR